MHKTTAEADAAAIDKAVNAMLEKAISRQATDVHIEPRERTIVVRFRIDGWLHEIAKLPLTALPGIIDNLQRRAGLDEAAPIAPQSGEFAFESEQLTTSVLVSTMPTLTGEKVALHLTPHISEPATLESLGYWGDMLHHIEQAAVEPHGLMLATSPNKTGASLSLLGIVHLLNNPALSIATLEDPIERQVTGVTQTQISPAHGIDFATGLQALLKQDPNVVMISDMHEQATVALALQAALSGHLMLGGLHVSSAAHGVAHLLHMHSEPFLVAAALKLSTGQRFARRLCPSCSESYKPDESVRKDLKKLLKLCGVTSVKQLHALEKAAAKDGVGPAEPSSLSTTETGIARLYRAKADGCPHCHFTGYAGRIGVCEVLVNSDAMKKLISKNPSVQDMHKLAVSEGMVPLQLDGFVKALRGLTTLDEILPMLATMPQ